MLASHIALVPDSPDAIDQNELARVSAALQRQVTRDLGPRWNVTATVDAFPRLEQVPLGYWPVILTRRSLGDEEGFHLTLQGEPFSIVEVTSGWSITASHEVLEMLVDPSGSRTVPGASPDAVTRVEFLLEVCDPCQSAACAYTVNDVLVSDFVLPAYYSPIDGAAGGYSFGNNVTAPHTLTLGGSMTWVDRARRKIVHLQQLPSGTQRTEYDLASNEARPLRARIHGLAGNRRQLVRISGMEHSLKATRRLQAASDAMRVRATMFRDELSKLAVAGPASLKSSSDADVKTRIDAALAQRDKLDPKLVDFLVLAKKDLDAPVPPKEEHYQLSVVRSALRSPIRPEILTGRDVPGIAQYDHEDVRWAKALWEYVTNGKATFPVCPQGSWPELVHPISDGSVLAIAGDWGTHDASSASIGTAITNMLPTHTIHLGDVYYAGTEDEERQFISAWPLGSAGTFVLNSNHEMYSGGGPYFSMALQSDRFDTQTYSYFALSSSRWLFIGLDSAYNATGNGVTPYDVGHLPAGDPQVAWLRWLLSSPNAVCADGTRKKICVLTHHQALETDGSAAALFGEVQAALGGRAPDLWYWGHIHGAAVYAARGGFNGRLAGHGGIPYISDFNPSNDAAARVTWAERSVNNAPGANGFVILRLRADGGICEEFYDERGTQHYLAVLGP